MVQPTLWLAFKTGEDSERAAAQHVCVCRNEDVLLPCDTSVMSPEDFDRIPGVELKFGAGSDSFLVGYNRYDAVAPMYGHLHIVDDDDESDGAE
jgi:hypothetical protein